MNTRLSELIKASGQMQLVYKPVFLRITDPLERIALDQLIENQVSFFHDEIYGQLQELVKMKNPAVRIKPEEYPELIQKTFRRPGYPFLWGLGILSMEQAFGSHAG